MQSEQQTPLTPQLEVVEPNDSNAIKGALSALFEAHFTPEVADTYAASIVDGHGYDNVNEFRTVTMLDLHEIGIPRGHQKRIARAIFAGNLPPSAPVQIPVFQQPQGGQPPPPPPSPAKKASKWERDLPDKPNPINFMEHGMALRTHLRETTDDAYADLVFERYTTPWTDLPAGHVHGSANEKVLCGLLLQKSLPDWANGLVQDDLKHDRGLKAVMTLCRQVFAVTDVSDAEIKAAVRTPDPCAQPSKASMALAQWDANVSSFLGRGFALDDHDRRTALYALVEPMKDFKTVVAQLKTTRPTPAPEIIRASLGLVADELALTASPKKAKAATKKKGVHK
jgi:hypothetical protein